MGEPRTSLDLRQTAFGIQGSLTVFRDDTGMEPRLALSVCGLILLAACTTPSPAMMRAGHLSREVSVDGARFRVDFTATKAEAHRLNMDMRVARAPMVMRGAIAIVLATGCTLKPRSLEGDQAIVTAALDCEGTPGTAPLRAPDPAQIACVIADADRSGRRPKQVLTDCLIE